MGYDTLSIISMNSSRKGLYSLSQPHRSRYLTEIFDNVKPDICFLPGDIGETGKDVVIGYSQYMTNDERALLFKPERIKMSEPCFSFTSFGDLPGLSYDSIVCPFVEVETLLPTPKRTIKQFSAISWRYQPWQCAGIKDQDRTKMSESLVIFAQRVGLTTRNPVLICGEFPTSYQEMMSIVKERNRLEKTNFLKGFQQSLGPQKVLPSIANGATWEQRQKIELELSRCKGFGKRVNTNEEVPDFFLASKELKLTEPSLMDVEQVTGRKVKMEVLRQHRPTTAKMEVPVRPPRHHGG